MPAKRVIVHVDCVNCGASLPLGGITSSVTCPGCNWSKDLPPEKWRWILDGTDRAVTSLETIVGETSTSLIGCPSCQTPLSDDAIAAGLASGAGAAACKKCGGSVPMRAISTASLGLETHFSAALGEGTAQPATSNAKVNIPCGRCGAPLPCDGTTSLPTCEFCHTRTPLPEDVWRQLHATGTVHPFFLWATPKAAREAAKKAVPLKGGERAIPYRALTWLGIGIPIIVGLGAVGFFLFRAPNAAAIPHGFGRIHESCDGQDAACTLDKKNSLRCVGDVWAVAMTCKGPNGCRVIKDGESISCDYTVADISDPCDVTDSACSTDRKTELKCDGTKFVAQDTCKGPHGCSMSPSTDGYVLSCDDHVADVGDACLESRPACASDKKSMLVCREGKFVTDHKCGGPSGCAVTPVGDKAEMSCDDGPSRKRTGR